MKAKNNLPYLEWTEPDTGEVKRLYADVITNESANLAAAVTQHAVERGSKITDHYRKEPEAVQVTYLFSGAPLRGDLDDDNPGTVEPVTLRYVQNKARNRPSPTPLKYEPNQNGPGLALLNPFNALSAGVDALGSALGIGNLPKNVDPSELRASAPGPKSIDALKFPSDPSARFTKTIELIRRLQTRGILLTVKTTFGPFENCGITAANVKRTPDMGTSGEIEFALIQMRFADSDIALALPLPLEPRAIPKKTASAAGADGKTPGGEQESAARKALREAFGVSINP